MMPGMHKAGAARTGQALSSPFFYLAAALLLVLAAAPGFGFTFEPMVQDFAPSGPGSIRSFQLSNPGSETIAVRIRMLSRQMDASGLETTQPADQLFVVYPSRITMEPNTEQAVRVQWKGPSTLGLEQSFRIVVEQLPVDFGGAAPQKGAIKVIFRYVGAIYVLPNGAKPNVGLESSRVTADSSGRDALEIVLANRGSAHTLLGDLSITLTSKTPAGTVKKVFGPDDLAGISGENLLPQSKRRFLLPLPADLPREGLDVSFTFEPLR